MDKKNRIFALSEKIENQLFPHHFEKLLLPILCI